MVIYFLSAYLWFLIILTADMYPSIILIKSYFWCFKKASVYMFSFGKSYPAPHGAHTCPRQVKTITFCWLCILLISPWFRQSHCFEIIWLLISFPAQSARWYRVDVKSMDSRATVLGVTPGRPTSSILLTIKHLPHVRKVTPVFRPDDGPCLHGAAHPRLAHRDSNQ